MSLLPGWGLLGIPAGLVTGLFFGLINGALIAFVRLPPFIVTLGSLTAVRGIARLIGDDTTVFNPRPAVRLHRQWPACSACPGSSIIAFVVIVVSWFILRRTVLGVRIYVGRRQPGGGAARRASRSGRSCCSSTASRACSPGSAA